jgi:hypothetical protein
MTSTLPHLAPVLDALRNVTATSFSFRGDNFAFSTEAEAETKLANVLYERCYMRRIDAPATPVSNGDGSLLDDLRAANAGRPRWQTGWRVDVAHNGGWISAQRDGLTRTFAPGEFVTKEGPGMPVRVGATVDVYFATESQYMQPGFYFAFGETVVDESDSASWLRFYWHTEPAGAALLLHSLSTQLNRFQTPYRFKCLTHPGAYVRADSAVLFVPRRWYQIAARLARDTRRSVASHLRADAPLFTKPLADGLAFAEDPGGSQSFGMHRCSALAKSIRGVAMRGSLLDAAEVEKALGEQGVSTNYPYLNPGSTDIYDFTP